MIRINISDYPDFKHYTSALELIFTKLAALGDNVSDNVRRFHLLEGLSDEYHAIVSSVVASEGPSGRHADFAKAVELISMYEDNFNSKRRKVNQDTTMFAKSPATSTRGSQRDASKRNRGGGDAQPDSGTLEPCVFFLKRGHCNRGSRCRFMSSTLAKSAKATERSRTKVAGPNAIKFRNDKAMYGHRRLVTIAGEQVI